MTEEEALTVIKAWIQASQDSIMDADMKSSTFWIRISSQYQTFLLTIASVQKAKNIEKWNKYISHDVASLLQYKQEARIIKNQVQESEIF